MSEPDQPDTPPFDADGAWVEIYRGRGRARWLELALVLEALGIGYRSGQSGDVLSLAVTDRDAARARLELDEYRAEMDDPSRLEPTVMRVGSGSAFLPAYWCVLLTLHAFSTHRVYGLSWWEAGRAQSGLLIEGEWWRAVTALTLHADGSHLLNNLVFGSLFGVLLAQDVGVGWAWLAMVLSGALGNGLNAWIRPPDHASIGASTGVFGAVGLLMGLQSRRPHSAPRSRLRRWAPPVVGAVFLGLLGTAGERTDVIAHLTGVAVGLAMGLGLGAAAIRWQLADRSQVAPAGAVLLILAGAWWPAFRGWGAF